MPDPYISTSGVARKINLSTPTVIGRVRERGIEPDGVLIGGTGKAESMIWKMERLPELRRLLANQHEIVV